MESSSQIEKGIIVSAPGKVILHGEHSVVYGKIAIASSLNLRTFLRLTPTNGNKISLSLPDIDVNVSWDTDVLRDKLTSLLPLGKSTEPRSASDEAVSLLKAFADVGEDASTKSLALIAFLYLYFSITDCESSLPSLNIHVSSNLPTSAGLGSSAAYSVCLATSLLLFSKSISQSEDGSWSDADKKLINDWSFQSEVLIHGKPSGIDNSVSTYGGALVFQNGAITQLKRVPRLRIMLTNTKVPRSTKVLVAGVREKYNKYKSIIGPVLDSMEAISETAVKVVEEETHSLSEMSKIFEELVDMNQHLLRLIGVSHQALDQICAVTQKHGLHSKLTGAGGGGCAFTILQPDIETSLVTTVQLELSTLGFDCWETSVGGYGIAQHFELDKLDNVPASFLL